MFLAWKSSWSFSQENGLLVVAVFMISWLAKQPNVTLSSSWLTKKIDWSDWVVSWPKLMIDYLQVERLIKPIDWMTYYWLQNCLSDDKLLVCDFGRLHVCAILFLYLLRNWWVHFKSLLLFHSSTEKKQAHNEEIPGKWLNWIIPYWCGRDYYWMPFISKSWYKANQISKFLLELNNPFSGILSWCSNQISQMATEMSIQGLNLNCSFLLKLSLICSTFTSFRDFNTLIIENQNYHLSN